MTNLIGKDAEDFTASAVMSNGEIDSQFNLKEYAEGKYVVLFFYPLDFTFVCPTELVAVNNRINDFKAINAEVLGISVDSHYSHLAWRNTPVKNGGVGKLNFPLVSDLSKKIASTYGALIDDAIALRASIMIDDEFKIFYQMYGQLSIGRNVDEILRLVKAAQHVKKYGDVCPASWNEGKEMMKPTADGTRDYLTSNEESL